MKLSRNIHNHKNDYDLFIFDIDGVLIDTSLSFPLAISKSVSHYGEMLGFKNWQPPAIIDIKLFKHFPGFNNDWDLDEGVLLFCLQRQFLSEPANLKKFLRQSAKNGRGVTGIKAWLQQQPADEREEIFAHFKPELLRQLAMEYYAGKDSCEFLYGFSPQYYFSDGTHQTEDVLVELDLLASLSHRISFGIYSGRNLQEFELIRDKIGGQYFDENMVFLDEGNQNQLKPSPEPLLKMLTISGKKGLIFFGDSLDDYQTVVNLRAIRPEIPSEFVQVGDRQEAFDKSISVVQSVNQFLEYVLKE